MITLTESLKKRFCKDQNLPIKVYSEPIFTERLKLFDAYEKYLEFCSMFRIRFDSDLVILYLMGTDLNAIGQIITYREKEHDMLMSIRNGEYMTEDGKKVRPEFYDLLKCVQDEYIYAVKHTVLPEKANMESLQEMMFGIYEKQFDRYKKKDFYNYLDQL